MFYFHEILKKRGKFGVIWLAATAPKRLSRRDVISVDVVRSSNDIIEVLTQYPSIGGRRNVHFSLYLSSQLMYGLISVNHSQSNILLDDIKTLVARLRAYRREMPSSINLTEPTSVFRVTFDEPDFENAPIDFGSFSLDDSSSVDFLPNYTYFPVSTPQSSGESSGPSDAPGGGMEHTVRHRDITMPEEVIPIREEEPLEDFQEPFDMVEEFRTLPSLASVTAPAPEAAENGASVREPAIIHLEPMPDEEIVPQPLETAEESVPPPLPPHEPESGLPGDQQVQDLTTPDVPVTIPEPIEPRRDQTPPRDRDQTSRSLLGEPSETSFVLGPAPARGRGRGRRRRRRLIIDAVTTIPPAILRRNIETANERLVRPHRPHPLRETAESLLSRFGSRAAARGNRRFWPNPRTLPEPDDPSRFGSFREEISEVLPEITAEETIPGVSTEETRYESREEPRKEDTHEDIRYVSDDLSRAPSGTMLSLRQSKKLQDSGDQISTIRVSSYAPDIVTPDILRGRSDIDTFADTMAEQLITETMDEPQLIIEPERGAETPYEPEAEQDVAIDRSKRRKTCIVSPERSPPPPSPELPSSPHMERAMGQIKEALAESPGANQTTFADVLRKSPQEKLNRMYVAKMFNHLLYLHKYRVIYIEQKEPDGDISIERNLNFDAFSSASSS